MAKAFVRQLGAQPGVQLNPLRDLSAGFAPGRSDQVFGIAMRSKRGRIDRAFAVNAGTALRRLGSGESIRANALNEALAQVYEALNRGAAGAVVHRLTTTSATLNYIIVTADATSGDLSFSTSATIPGTPHFLAIRHLDCFGDGIRVEIHADAVQVSGVPADARVITLNLRDPVDNELLFSVTGSLDAAALDDFGRSYYLPSVASQYDEEESVQITVPSTSAVKVGSNAYGRDVNSIDKYARSAVLTYFVEGGTGYQAADYTLARTRLAETPLQFEYIASGGSQSTALLAQMVQLAFDTGRQFRFDVSGALTADQAITFVNQLSIDSHYCHAFWAPLLCDDALNGGKAMIGTAAFNIARACLRNADTNAQGLARKNEPIAGRAHPLTRTGVRQLVMPSQADLSNLAVAHINPVLFETFEEGGLYVFSDSLTLAKTNASFRKLIAVSDMSSDIDNRVTRFARGVIQLPVSTAIRRISDYLQGLFEAAQGAGWLVPSDDLDGAAFRYEVSPNRQNPEDRIDIAYALRYDGTTRQIFVTQSIVR